MGLFCCCLPSTVQGTQWALSILTELMHELVFQPHHFGRIAVEQERECREASGNPLQESRQGMTVGTQVDLLGIENKA